MVKAVLKGNKDMQKKTNLDAPKDGFVQKKKNQKFKQTPSGKVALINGSKAKNNGGNSPQQKLSEKNKQKKQANKSKNDKKQQESSKKELAKKNLVLVEEEDDTDSELDEDINEGVPLQHETTITESDESEDEEESEDESEEEKSVPNILGNSLADESDEDDDDYDAEEEEEESVEMKKGVKMFKGTKKTNSSTDSSNVTTDRSVLEESISEGNDEESEDDEDEDADDDDDDDDNDDDDEVFEGEEEEDGTLDSDEIEKEVESDDEEDDEEDDEDESEDEDADESALGLKALVDNTIVDDDEDDEDFVEPGDTLEDDDISDEADEDEEEGNSTFENSLKSEETKDADSSLEKLKTDKCTIFIGNLPKEATKAQLKKLFKKFGTIETIRLRGIISKSLNVPKKVAAITKEVHPKLKSVYAYIQFDSEESANAALSMNGTLFEGNYLRVDTSEDSKDKYNVKKSVFLGNLSFNVDDNTIRKHFEQCGEIESVRVVRDNKTGVGKGFGFVNFKTEDAVALALELDGTTILKREVRVKPNIEQQNKKGKNAKRSRSAESEKNVAHKKSKNNAEVAVPVINRQNAEKRIAEKEKKLGKKQSSPQQGNSFQGKKADAGKKKKQNKLEKKKKILAEKLTAKPKKPTK